MKFIISKHLPIRLIFECQLFNVKIVNNLVKVRSGFPFAILVCYHMPNLPPCACTPMPHAH